MGLSDDVVYVVLLVISLPIGYYVRKILNPKQKQNLCTGVGVSILILVCGVNSLHSIFTTLVNTVIIYLWPRKCHIISFVWCFGYIVFFRMTPSFGLPPIPSHCNAVQLILTLKLVGLANEMRDTALNEDKYRKSQDPKLLLEKKYQEIHPSFLDILHYVYCYIGLLTGPYYKYRTYYDMINNKNTKHIDTFQPIFYRIKWVPLYASIFIIGGLFFNIQYVRTDEFYDEPFWYRLLFMTPMFYLFRMRFYIAWTIAEGSCMSAALGAYPVATKPRIGKGPTAYEGFEIADKQAPEGVAYDFETIRNIDIYGCELSPTVREAVKSWNTTVQYWLANTIYKKLPFRSGPLKVAITMSVSAFWHGMHPGYYLSFLTVPLCMMAEEAMQLAFRNDKSAKQQQIYDWCAWFMSLRALDYMCMSFLLLTLSDTLGYWYSIYFAAHVQALFFLAVGLYFKPRKVKQT